MNQAVKNKGVIYEFGQYVLDPDERVLLGNGEPIHLSEKVFDTLHLLILHNGKLLTKEQMMSTLWAESFVEESNLAKNISRLRKILNVDETALIETVPRRGYRFAADIKELNGDTSLLIRRNLKVKVTQTTEDGEEEAAEKKQIESAYAKPYRSRLSTAVAAGLLLTVGAGLGAFYFLQGGAAQPRAEEGAIRLTNDPANDFWPRWTDDGQIRFFRLGSDKRGMNLIMNADGTDQREVGFKGEEFRNFLHWSPDGSKVVFSKPGDNSATYLANADGSNEIILPRIGNTDWSADSKRIVYQLAIGEEKNSELFIYTIETGKTENVSNHPGFDADPNFSPDGSQIVFTTTRDNNAEIYLMNSDGSNVRRLTKHAAWDSHPVFSPDGTTIAFNADRDDENSDVYLMNSDGGDIRRLLAWKSNESVEPGCWSRDGTRIAFFSDREGNDEIYVTSAEVYRPQLVLADAESDLNYPSLSPEGRHVVFQAVMPDKTGELRIYDIESKQTRVLAKTENGDLQPAVSPDGMQIIFQNKVESNTEIFLVNADGSGLMNLTENAARDVCPSFSRDGKKISFATNRAGNTAAFYLYTMNVDGSEQRRLYLKEGLIYSSSWSPDGREIVFVKDTFGAGNFDLFAVALDDPSIARQLTNRRRSDGYPSISPDGERIAFASDFDGNWEVYLMNRDGTGLMRLTRDAAADGSPRWSPDGKGLIFNSDRTGKFALYTIDLSSHQISSSANSNFSFVLYASRYIRSGYGQIGGDAEWLDEGAGG